MNQYRKKLVVIEAEQFTGSGASMDRIREWANSYPPASTRRTENIAVDAAWEEGDPLVVYTLEGPLTATPGDWVIRGVTGEFYPEPDTIFRETYEPV